MLNNSFEGYGHFVCIHFLFGERNGASETQLY